VSVPASVTVAPWPNSSTFAALALSCACAWIVRLVRGDHGVRAAGVAGDVDDGAGRDQHDAAVDDDGVPQGRVAVRLDVALHRQVAGQAGCADLVDARVELDRAGNGVGPPSAMSSTEFPIVRSPPAWSSMPPPPFDSSAAETLNETSPWTVRSPPAMTVRLPPSVSPVPLLLDVPLDQDVAAGFDTDVL
jgi:hypothetical protein